MPLQHPALRNNGSNNKQRGVYTKVKAIGKGAFGEVFLVTKPGSSEQLVLKEVSMKGMNPRDKKSTMNEVTVLKKLSHPNIVAFHESFVESDVLCVVMEYAPGGDLGNAIAIQKKTGKRFPEATVLRYLAEIVSAMAYCHHDLHLLHRDLKPQNIFIGRGGACKLGDFGISKVMAASKAMAQTQCGTPLYMAPELCRGARYDRGADCWAVGCVLYELMALAPPWMDRVGGPNAPGGIGALLRLISNNTLNLAPLRAHFSPELCNLLGSLLAKAPENRPSLEAILAMPLVQNALPKQPHQPHQPPTPHTPAPPPSVPAAAAPPGSACKYRPGSVVMVKRTSGAETMAVVDRHEASNGLYTLTLLNPAGKVEGSKQAPEPDLRAPSTPLERQLMQQQEERTSAAEVLQRSFQRKKAPNAPPPALAAILESPNAPGQRGRQPLIFKHAANVAVPQPGMQQQPHKPESLRQQQQRLANQAKVNQAARGARAPYTPFRPLIS